SSRRPSTWVTRDVTWRRSQPDDGGGGVRHDEGRFRAMWSTLVDSLVYFPDRELYGDPADVGLAFTDLTIPTEDGERLHAWWIPTRAAPARGHVLFFHGNAGNVSHRLEHARALTGAGLDVLLVDYRGYGRSTGRPHEAGLALDAQASLAAMRTGAAVDPARVVLMGESLGG